MTLSNNLGDQVPTSNNIIPDDCASNWNSLYCSHRWPRNHMQKTSINGNINNKMIKYCYTCKGKIRKYEIRSPGDNFIPNNYFTPNSKLTKEENIITNNEQHNNSTIEIYNLPKNISSDINPTIDLEIANVENNSYIPSISREVESSFRQKYTSYEVRPNDININQRRLRKSLKGLRCIVNFSLTDSPVKKRTQIQACSISVMIVAIVAISFILVNFATPSFTRATDVRSTIVVPTPTIDINETSTFSKINSHITAKFSATEYTITTFTPSFEIFTPSTEATSLFSNILEKIRKNIRTFPKDVKKEHKRKDINSRELSQTFCSCQTGEVCMLDESSGTSICKKAIDTEDPTGCGGLCALETEACHIVDRALGVRVCRLLTLMTCSPKEWRCRNGLCVSANARCDGSIQCYDRSDEMFCECDLTKQFRCGHSISCFPKHKLCDGIIDCWDGHDELNCTNECAEDQFTCTDGQCILPTRFCDGLADCIDGSDEPYGCVGACGAHEIRCQNKRCVPHAVRCDGHDNCGDGTDELHCS